jgi:hypothetical protein
MHNNGGEWRIFDLETRTRALEEYNILEDNIKIDLNYISCEYQHYIPPVKDRDQ